MRITEKALSLHSMNNGALAERLGTGLQNLLQRFDSARHLKHPPVEAIPQGGVLLGVTYTTFIADWSGKILGRQYIHHFAGHLDEISVN